MTVHRCVTPTLLACSICERKERLCFSLHCECGLQNCTHAVYIVAFISSLMVFRRISLNRSVFKQHKRQFVIIADNYLRKSYRLSTKEAGLRFPQPVLSQSLVHLASRCPPDLGGGLRSSPRGLI